MQDDPVTFISKTAASDKPLDQYPIPFAKALCLLGQRFATGHDGNVTSRFA